uniref:Uncharacterized protein n=1 Tax=Amblyomma parvum TaxID=251391 RepID=A0A023FYS1_AMBPA
MLEASSDSLLSAPGTSSAGSVTDSVADSVADDISVPHSEVPVKKARAVNKPRRPLKPVLRTSRGRNLKLTARYKGVGWKDDASNWTINERKQLLDALKQHGNSDLEKLAQAVPTRSATAINHFLMERRRKVDRIVLEGAAGKRTAQALRILRRALHVKRRRFDRSQALTQVVASCQRQPLPDSTETEVDGGELPQFEDIYQMLREVMENKVPAALGDCEQYVVRRLLGTLTTIVDSLSPTLNEEREVLRDRLAWAAEQPVMTSQKAGAPKPRIEPGEKHSINFPSMTERMENLKSAWNPLRLPTEIIQRQWSVINELLAANVFRSERTASLELSTPLPGARQGSRRDGPATGNILHVEALTPGAVGAV